jgi:hypothetical protein
MVASGATSGACRLALFVDDRLAWHGCAWWLVWDLEMSNGPEIRLARALRANFTIPDVCVSTTDGLMKTSPIILQDVDEYGRSGLASVSHLSCSPSSHRHSLSLTCIEKSVHNMLVTIAMEGKNAFRMVSMHGANLPTGIQIKASVQLYMNLMCHGVFIDGSASLYSCARVLRRGSNSAGMDLDGEIDQSSSSTLWNICHRK